MIRKLLKNQKNPGKTGIIEKNREISYAELLRKSEDIEKLLQIGQQGNVCVLLPNCGDYLASVFACFRVARAVMPINVSLTKSEIIAFVRQARVDTVITWSSYAEIFEDNSGNSIFSYNIIFADKIETQCKKDNFIDIVQRSDEQGTETSFFQKKYNTIDSVQMTGDGKELLSFKGTAVDEETPMLLLSTSGTTGTPKIVQLSQKNLQTAVFGYLDKLVFDNADLEKIRYILCVPFSSVYGIMILTACLFMSFPIVVLENSFTLDALFLAAEKHKVTHYEGSGSVVLLLEKMIGKKIPCGDTLRYFGFGGSKISGDIIERVQKAYKKRMFYQGYGMTETSPLIAKYPQITLAKPQSVGTAIKGTIIAIDDGNKISDEPFVRGEILVRGDNVMLGYLDNQVETDKIFKNGYLCTGDIGYLDDEGYLYISGRKKNIIIVRGFNVYPEEIEECILKSRFALDCVVYGQADSAGNEKIYADIIPADNTVSEKEIRQHCAKFLAIYKLPRVINFVDSIAKSTGGKTERK